MQTKKELVYRWLKKRAKHAIVWIAAIGIVGYGLLVDAFNKARELVVKASQSTEQWTSTQCFPWLRNAWWIVDYAISRAWQWFGQKVPTWKEIRAPLIVGLFIIAAFCISQAFQPRQNLTVWPNPFASQSIRIGPQVDLSELDAIQGALDTGPGKNWFVATTGNDTNNCLNWEHPCLTISAAIAKTQAYRGDSIYIAPGTYDVSADGTQGILVDVDGIRLVGVGRGVTVVNSDTANNGAVITVNADYAYIERLNVLKGEIASTGSAGIRFTGFSFGGVIEDTIISVGNAATHIGLDITGGAAGVLFRSSSPLKAGMFGVLGAGVGTGVRFDGIQSALGDVTVNFFATCVHLTGNARWVQINDDTSLNSCQTQGILVDAGARDNLLDASVLNSPIKIKDNSGYATNSSRASIEALRTTVEHAADPLFPGTFIVVDGVDGKDTNSGLAPSEAVRTINTALSLVKAGDGIVIRSDGTYTETVTIATNAIQLFPSHGVVISGGLVITANNVWIRRPLEVKNNGGIGVQVTGSNARIENVSVTDAITAFAFTGDQVTLRNLFASGYSNLGFLFELDSVDGDELLAVGGGADVVGFSVSDVQNSRVSNASSIGNVTTSFLFSATTANNLCIDCTSSSNSGVRVDLGQRNMWARYTDQMETEPHQHFYPFSDGEGSPGSEVSIGQSTEGSTNQDYWGDTVRIIPRNVITGRMRLLGVGLTGGVQTTKDLMWQLLIAQESVRAERDGGNIWNTTETVLTTDDTVAFEVGDYLWVSSTAVPGGEIVIVDVLGAGGVITISTEDRAGAGTGLRYNHGTAGCAVTLVWREGDDRYHPIDGSYSGANRSKLLNYFYKPRVVYDAAVIARSVNGTDSVNSPFGLRVIWE